MYVYEWMFLQFLVQKKRWIACKHILPLSNVGGVGACGLMSPGGVMSRKNLMTSPTKGIVTFTTAFSWNLAIRKSFIAILPSDGSDQIYQTQVSNPFY